MPRQETTGTPKRGKRAAGSATARGADAASRAALAEAAAIRRAHGANIGSLDRPTGVRVVGSEPLSWDEALDVQHGRRRPSIERLGLSPEAEANTRRIIASMSQMFVEYAAGLRPQAAPAEPDPDELEAQALLDSFDGRLAEIDRRIDRVLARRSASQAFVAPRPAWEGLQADTHRR